jgi:hypothetical protein
MIMRTWFVTKWGGEGVVLCRKENEKEEEMRKEKEGLVWQTTN